MCRYPALMATSTAFPTCPGRLFHVPRPKHGIDLPLFSWNVSILTESVNNGTAFLEISPELKCTGRIWSHMKRDSTRRGYPHLTRRTGTNKMTKWPTSRQNALSFLKSKISLEEALSTKKINSERQKKRKKEKGSEKERNHKTRMGWVGVYRCKHTCEIKVLALIGKV